MLTIRNKKYKARKKNNEKEEKTIDIYSKIFRYLYILNDEMCLTMG